MKTGTMAFGKINNLAQNIFGSLVFLQLKIGFGLQKQSFQQGRGIRGFAVNLLRLLGVFKRLLPVFCFAFQMSQQFKAESRPFLIFNILMHAKCCFGQLARRLKIFFIRAVRAS